MLVSYEKLWKLLIDHKLTRTALRIKTDISKTTLAKLGKSEPVTLEVLAKICFALNCNIADIVEFTKENVK